MKKIRYITAFLNKKNPTACAVGLIDTSLFRVQITIFFEMAKYFTAIIFTIDGKPLKYRNVRGGQADIARFEKFAATKKARYINYYDKKTRSFTGRKYL